MKKKHNEVSIMSDNDWRAEDDLRTLIEAEKIKKDAKRIKAAMIKLRELKKAVNSIADKAKT